MLNRRIFVIGTGAAAALIHTRAVQAQLVNKTAGELANGEFNWHPERSPSGPVLIIVSITDQLVHVYRNGIRIAASTCSTGKPGHRTPTGVFTILQKDRHHRSSTYSNAPMPNMNRLTWSGIALHAGNLPGYPASHGCVRLPLQFSDLLFGITRLGMTVVLADEHSQPASVVHPGMVLGEYARHEFSAVDTSIKRAQYSEGRTAPSRNTSVVVSGASRKMHIYEDGRPVASGGVVIVDAHKPLARAVHTLTATDDAAGGLRWSSTSHGKSDRADLGADLRRIKADPGVRAELRKRMHHGMTIVTTDEPADEAYRTKDGFVVLDGVY